MAKAPTPGKGPSQVKQQQEQEEATQRTALNLSVGDKTYTLHMDDLGPHDDLLARKQTGLPVTPFFEDERFGTDSMMMLLWIARRKDGEPNLRYDEVIKEYPNMKAIQEANFRIEAEEQVEVEDETPLA